MATIVDYASLKQAVSDFTHRADLASGNYIDYFIQSAQEQINKDIFAANFGNGIRLMEKAYGPYSIAGAVLQVPADWIAPKIMTVSDGSGDIFTLIFKDPQWIYDNYPVRQASGVPSYIARDVQPASSFTGVVSTTTLTVSAFVAGGAALGIGSIVDDITGNLAFNSIITALGTGTGGNGTYTLNNSQSVSSEAMTGGGNAFIFGPYPDSSYSVQGTYYAAAALLSGTATTNWMVLNAPLMIHAACMVEAAKFLVDDTMLQRWATVYGGQLNALVQQDKAERFSAATMQIELG